MIVIGRIVMAEHVDFYNLHVYFCHTKELIGMSWKMVVGTFSEVQDLEVYHDLDV